MVNGASASYVFAYLKGLFASLKDRVRQLARIATSFAPQALATSTVITSSQSTPLPRHAGDKGMQDLATSCDQNQALTPPCIWYQVDGQVHQAFIITSHAGWPGHSRAGHVRPLPGPGSVATAHRAVHIVPCMSSHARRLVHVVPCIPCRPVLVGLMRGMPMFAFAHRRSCLRRRRSTCCPATASLALGAPAADPGPVPRPPIP